MAKYPHRPKENKLLDFLVMLLLLVVSVIYAILAKDLFIGRSLFVGVALMGGSVVYLGWRKQKNWKKLILGALIFGSLFGFALSFFAEATKAWTTNSYIFNVRFLGVNSFEEIIGQGFMALYTFTVYEHFFDDEKRRKINKRYFWGILAGAIGSIAVVILFTLVRSDRSAIAYAYDFAAIVALVPLVYLLVKHKHLIPKFAMLSIFFFFVWLVLEYVAVQYNYWSYPGIYIGWIELLGIRFPFEELFFWMLMYSPAITAYYEATIDDSE